MMEALLSWIARHLGCADYADGSYQFKLGPLEVWDWYDDSYDDELWNVVSVVWRGAVVWVNR